MEVIRVGNNDPESRHGITKWLSCPKALREALWIRLVHPPKCYPDMGASFIAARRGGEYREEQALAPIMSPGPLDIVGLNATLRESHHSTPRGQEQPQEGRLPGMYHPPGLPLRSSPAGSLVAGLHSGLHSGGCPRGFNGHIDRGVLTYPIRLPLRP